MFQEPVREMQWEAAAAAAAVAASCGTLNASALGDAERSGLLQHRRGNRNDTAKCCPAPQSGMGLLVQRAWLKLYICLCDRNRSECCFFF